VAVLQAVRGTHDFLPEESLRFRHIEAVAHRIASLYGFDEIITPIFEFTEVFARTLGESSDVVSKEMYSFIDRSGDSLTLRPEGTAGVARAFISNGLTQSIPAKFFYRGPMFRHERPQKGRHRQFHQVGVELLGSNSPQADVEVISLGHHFLSALGLSHLVTLEINSLGDPESRRHYRQAFVDFLHSHKNHLSSDSLIRLEKNPLRILDSKDHSDREILKEAPLLRDYLNKDSQEFFEQVLSGLEALGISYKLNPQLVRGLDYYGHTAFEFITQSLGAQGTVLAGGRYDGLIVEMGGAVTPSIGWAAGVERLSLLLTDSPSLPRPIILIPMGLDSQAMPLAFQLRHHGLRIELGFGGSLKKRLSRADKIKARAAIILGEEEARRHAVAVRDLDNGVQQEVELRHLTDYLRQFQ
jgi:histidyl-tRNA synthetase